MITIKFLIPVALMLPAAGVAYAPQDEIGYSKGALGTDALMKGDNERALQQILTSKAEADDPARLINLGRVYARMGRKTDAINAFQAAIDSREHFDVMLSDGRVMDSREVARLSLRKLQLSVVAR